METFKLIQERQSSRDPHDSGRRVAKQDLLQILEAARWAPTPHNLQNFEIIIIDDRKLLEVIADLRRPVHCSRVQESYRKSDAYASSEEDLLRRKVGILVDSNEKTRSNRRKNVKTSPVLGIIVYDPAKKPPNVDGDFLNVLGLGCVLENMWLMANSLGISFQALSGLIGESEKEVKTILNIPEDLKIALAFRLGFALPTLNKNLRVRREVGEFTHYNRFGNKSFD